MKRSVWMSWSVFVAAALFGSAVGCGGSSRPVTLGDAGQDAGVDADAGTDGGNLSTPVLESIAPQSGIDGEEVTLAGSGFSAVAGGNIVRFGSTTATLTAATATQLKAIVPAGLALGSVDVTVEVDAQRSSAVPFNLVAAQKLSFTTSGIANASGTITASPAGVSCGTNANCIRFPAGTSVTLTASGDSAFTFLETWGGDCTGDGSCTLQMSADHSVTAQFSPANKVFVTSDSFYPDSADPQGSVTAHCQARADAAGLGGTYVGWLGSNAANFSSLLGTASGWVQVDGKPFAASEADRAAGKTLYPIRVNELGAVVPTGSFVLSGQVGYDCSGWTSTSGFESAGRVGGDWRGDGTYSGYASAPCGTPLPVYCFETDYSVKVTYARASGRIAFVASNGAAIGGGLAAFDKVCTDSASAAGLPGTYKAAVATTTTTVASRFTTAGAPWVRTDGIPVVASAADLFASGGPVLIAPVSRDETGAQNFGLVVTGANDATSTGTSGTTCADYTDRLAGKSIIVGTATAGDGMLFGNGWDDCSQGFFAVCLQE